ncbi:hypothetical protein K438DRAFT_1771383 [Mycena galopus ATCC 62051]|nr:hypothetical protein K438DRAFT_1771383 [Mycena galopus ATCC 62051]
MSGSGVTYYQEELKDLLRLLKNLPDTIPIGDHHNFIGYAPDGKEVDEKGCSKSVSRGPGLEQVVEVLRSFITGNGGPNRLETPCPAMSENPPDPSSNAFPGLSATSIDSRHDGVDITLPFFRDLLSDKPIAGASVVGSLANWAEQVESTARRGKNSAGNTTWEGEVDSLTF